MFWDVNSYSFSKEMGGGGELVVAAMTIGAACGTVLAGFSQDSIGRKMTLVLASLVYSGS